MTLTEGLRREGLRREGRRRGQPHLRRAARAPRVIFYFVAFLEQVLSIYITNYSYN